MRIFDRGEADLVEYAGLIVNEVYDTALVLPHIFDQRPVLLEHVYDFEPVVGRPQFDLFSVHLIVKGLPLR